MAAMSGWRAMALAGVVALGATGGTDAQTVVGRWVLRSEPDNFGDGGTYAAATADRSGAYVLAIRCIRKEWSLALGEASMLPRPLPRDAIYRVKLRVDRGPITDAVGVTLDQKLIQFVTKEDFVQTVIDGKALAVRLQGDTAIIDITFSLRQAKQALAAALNNCPIDVGALPACGSSASLAAVKDFINKGEPSRRDNTYVSAFDSSDEVAHDGSSRTCRASMLSNLGKRPVEFTISRATKGGPPSFQVKLLW